MIVDTNILIDFLRGQPGARSFLLSLTSDAVPSCSVISVAEIHAGMRESERNKVQQLLGSMTVLPVTNQMAEMAGSLKRNARGLSLTLDDCLIAATAVTQSEELATRNARHYPMDQVKLVVPQY